MRLGCAQVEVFRQAMSGVQPQHSCQPLWHTSIESRLGAWPRGEHNMLVLLFRFETSGSCLKNSAAVQPNADVLWRVLSRQQQIKQQRGAGCMSGRRRVEEDRVYIGGGG